MTPREAQELVRQLATAISRHPESLRFEYDQSSVLIKTPTGVVVRCACIRSISAALARVLLVLELRWKQSIFREVPSLREFDALIPHEDYTTEVCRLILDHYFEPYILLEKFA